MGSFLLLLLISFSAPLLIFSTGSHENVVCHPDDQAALLDFKASFPPGAAAFATWNTGVSCCEWQGILCGQDRVIGLLFLNETSVLGPIPPAIGDLEFLQLIILSNLPNLVGPIPAQLTKLKKLGGLLIFNTNLNTPIPSFIGQFNLQTLILSQNNHWGPIPGSLLQNSVDRVYLDLSGNQLSGPIPPTFGNVDLGFINLSRNALTGDASFLFGRSKSVGSIILSKNFLEFDLTNVVFPEANLTALYLDNNRIRGSIPSQIADVKDLRELDLSNNQLCGKIPTGVSMRKFGASSYSNNKCLCGTPLPSCLCHPNDQAALSDFKASFPPGAAAFATWNTSVSCCSWRGISCDEDRVAGLVLFNEKSVLGPIPPAIGDLEFLQVIILSWLPNLVGPIPGQFAKLKKLIGLVIFNTNLNTPIPSFIGQFNLQTLILGQNNHWGPIPSSLLQNSIGHVYLDLSGNQLSGPIPPAFGNVDFQFINLSSNGLTGDASFLFGRSKSVGSIILSKNFLEFDLTNLSFPEANLTTLYLDNNQIRGSIPPQISNVRNLKELDLSNNQLCGRIPTGGQMGKFKASSYSNNKCLCGTPLPSCLSSIYKGPPRAFAA